MKSFRSLLNAVGLVAAVGFSAQAFADPSLTLTLDDLALPGVEVTVGPAVGSVQYTAPLGGGSVWTTNFTAGFGSPNIPNPTAIDVVSFNASTPAGAAGAGDLKITLTATGVDSGSTGAGVLGFLDSIGGTVNGAAGSTASWEAYVNGTLYASGTGGPGAFSGSDSFSAFVADLSNFTMQIVVTLHHTAGGSSSFDHELISVPEPGTLLLLGVGLIGLAFIRRRSTSV